MISPGTREPLPLDPERWDRLWRAFDVEPPPLLDDLLARYGEAGRFYHTREHIGECLRWLEEVRSLCDHPGEVELALWFHDAVYDSRRADNEEESARLAERAMQEAGVAERSVQRVEELILATRHDRTPFSHDDAAIVDIDLTILGAGSERFDRYERDIRREYAWVEESAYRDGRSRLLRGFLERPSIYTTQFFHDLFEERARRNIERALAALAGEGE